MDLTQTDYTLKGRAAAQVADAIAKLQTLYREHQKLVSKDQATIAQQLKGISEEDLQKIRGLEQDRKDVESDLKDLQAKVDQATAQGIEVSNDTQERLDELIKKQKQVEDNLTEYGFSNLDKIAKLVDSFKFSREDYENQQYVLDQFNEIKYNILETACERLNIKLDVLDVQDQEYVFNEIVKKNSLETVPFFLTEASSSVANPFQRRSS